MKNGRTLVMIGNGMVGQEVLNLMVKRSEFVDWKIIVHNEESYYAYDRVALSSYYDTRTANALSMVESDFYIDNGITIFCSDPIIHVNRKEKCVTSQKGFVTKYDKLIFATGANSFIPPIPGIKRDGVFGYRTIDDLKNIDAYSQTKNHGVVIGGGLLGLECANALKKLSLNVDIIELSPHLMPAQLDAIGGNILKRKIEAKGFVVHTGKTTERIYDNCDGKKIMQFSDNSELVTDIIVVSAGIHPRNDLAKKCELEISPNEGININTNCQTSDDNIYAIGDCASYNGKIHGLVAPGYEMARTVVSHLLDNQGNFTEKSYSTKLKLIGVDVATIGNPLEVSANNADVVYVNGLEGIYTKLVLAKPNNHVIGAVMVGDLASYDLINTHFESNIPLPNNVANYLLPNSNNKTNPLTLKIPDAATVCSCKGVTKAELTNLINDHKIKQYDMLGSVSIAGSGCTGCVPTLKKIIHQTCEKNGWSKSKAICEHFNYSRQELLDLISVKGITSFREAIETLGRGCGCETCQPLISSILSTTHNALITLDDQMPAQDFNDRYLANIQRDGTYSIIPRIPGGEITPSRLAKLADLATKHGLYTRITGGQRISFFGAQIHQLPDIWHDLISNGFESGHAYGKALRTVKTCVGDTWCPWGVQDSTSLAIKIEDRYKGLRSPHKTKIGVSGCVRDCAEAKIKDFGIIATDGGWTLYIAGNGGRDVQIAVVLAENLNDEMIIKYMDRLFMYYIQTANHLARTGTWLNNIEGGIEHIRQVIIHDSLNICKDLEDTMSKLLARVECEWKSILKRKESKARYRHYVNSELNDKKIQHTYERDQIRPVKFYPKNSDLSLARQSIRKNKKWQRITATKNIVPGSGVCALVDGVDVALFKSNNNTLFALDNIDPFTNASVLSRGILGDKNNEPMVISPISRKKFSLQTGQCLDDNKTHLRVFEIRENQGMVEVAI